MVPAPLFDTVGGAGKREARTLVAERQGLPAGLSVREVFWTEEECRSIERDINGIKALADSGRLKSGTVDRTPLRSKYFFGHGYTYGAQVSGKGQEQLLPPEYVDPIPDWVHSKLIARLEEQAIVPKGWINSAVVNDYSPGGMIVSHIDPKQLFARPICIATFFAEGRLVFGVQFTFEDRRFSAEKSSAPKFVACMPRGSLTLMDGFSADGITHGIRPEDFDGRRVSVVLRHVFSNAPTMSDPSAVLKPAQRGAPAGAARRVGPGSAAMAFFDDRRALGGEAKRTFAFELCDDDEPAAKSRRGLPPPGGGRPNKMEMMRRIQGTYSDERSGNVYEVSINGLVRVTFASRGSFGSAPATTTWKVEPDGEGRFVCGKGLLTEAGIRSDRLVWTSRDGSGGHGMVWLRAEGDATALAAAAARADEEGPFGMGDDLGMPGMLGSQALGQGLAPKAGAVVGPWGGLPRNLMGGIRGPMSVGLSGMPPGPGSAPSGMLRPLRGPTSLMRPSASVGSLTAIGPGRPGGMGLPPPNRMAQGAGPFGGLRGMIPKDGPGLRDKDAGMGLPSGWRRPDTQKAENSNGRRREPEWAQEVVPQTTDQFLPPPLVEAGQPTPAQRKWFYKDAHGKVQGPYASSTMSEWSRLGYFPESTLVKAEDEEVWSELGNGMRLLTG